MQFSVPQAAYIDFWAVTVYGISTLTTLGMFPLQYQYSGNSAFVCQCGPV